jgi:magnesium-transporting ATPase (P-type)
LKQRTTAWASDGKTLLYAAADGLLLGAFAVEDEIRPESSEAVAELHRLGMRVAMITGDSKTVANSVARRIGIDEVAAEVLPADKAGKATFSKVSLHAKSPTGDPQAVVALSKDMKGLAAFRTKAKYGKMSIEGRDLVNTQPSHYSEARAIHDGKILVTPGNANIPSNFQIRQGNRFDCRYPTPQAFPKSVCGFAVKLVVK